MDHLQFEPGEKRADTDINYILLDLIIEEVSGMPLSGFIKDKVYLPAGMKTTVLASAADGVVIPNRAYGTFQSPESKTNLLKDQNFSSATRGDGATYTSLKDLYAWDQALYTEALVSKDLLEEAYAPNFALTSYVFEDYNCGWYHIKNTFNEHHMFHNGRTLGFSTHYTRMPDKNNAIIILCNLNEHDRVYQWLPEKIKAIYELDGLPY